MYLIRQTEIFSKWLHKLKDVSGKVSIIRRIERIKSGNFGDSKSVGDEVFELRITTGPGYRVYYTKRDDEIVILLLGGDKSTQSKDILKAKQIKEELKDEQFNYI
ncbi:type II toxin-antitoxin system RelE/ParE family toxin [Sulfurimonas sp.]|jgi:putative addiction module killer protein|uniref:type II toxin-antitoxin system RelE/ParE family toxin n=1 Tax=Sulfurimonas sp. TaxID=2022749 RepID=UPI002A36E41B|nr:type II toxin-antitoxin system RelE/ParE family toxin [Sulfurimonas sp.]MDY0122923.1 type II toxin-antitoxin system RelE/ParE family toxin [Sulfurimonas sp.]